MVVTSKQSWGRILRQVGAPLALVTIVSLVAATINAIEHPFKAIAIPDLTVSILGAVLGMLLGFRTNSAYDRWWEARKLWGALVNSSRSLARQATSFICAPSPEAREEAQAHARALVHQQIAFVHALRFALRKQEPWEELGRILDGATVSSLQTQ